MRRDESSFADLFSTQAGTYAAARPSYPRELLEAIVACCPRRDVAWDAGTGNGQAARDLARYFEMVIATDASAEQLRHAVAAPNVEYRVATSEHSGIASGTVSLVTVAQALHWFDHDRFYDEVRRVAAAGAIIAAWSYGSCYVTPAIDEFLRQLEFGTVGSHWHPNRRFVDEGYKTIQFPFPEIELPTFELRVEWSLSQLGEYLQSWSAVAAFRRDTGQDPVAPVLGQIAKHWGPPEATRPVTWPLSVRVGRIG